jgi:hypothetical protein
MFFDNNFLFFVTVTATLDDSRRSSITILKEDHICILSIWFDCISLFTGFQNNFFNNFLFIVTMVAMFDGVLNHNSERILHIIKFNCNIL